MVYVFENADDFEEQIQVSPEHVISYLRNEFVDLIDQDDFEEGLYAHLSGGYGRVNADYIRLRLQTAFDII